MNILIPMVLNNALIDKDNQFSKILFEIQRKTILQHIIERLSTINNSKFIFIIHEIDSKKYHIDDILTLLIPEAKVVVSKGSTKGSACSCLLAIDHIDNEEPLLIVGSDQIVNIDLQAMASYFLDSDFEGGTVIFEDIHPRWSFVKLDTDNNVIEVAEKRPISKNASAGYYFFKKGSIFVDAAMQMIKKREMINDQYYVSPVFNEMIISGKKIGVYKMNKSDYFSLTSEKGIEEFEKYLSCNDD